MDIRRILRNRDKLSDIMIALDDVANEVEEPKRPFENINMTMIDLAVSHCEEAHRLLEWLYLRLLDEEYKEVCENEDIKRFF